MYAAVWVAPNGGLLPFWPSFAVLLLLSAMAVVRTVRPLPAWPGRLLWLAPAAGVAATLLGNKNGAHAGNDGDVRGALCNRGRADAVGDIFAIHQHVQRGALAREINARLAGEIFQVAGRVGQRLGLIFRVPDPLAFKGPCFHPIVI